MCVCVCLVLRAWCRVSRPVTHQIYTVRTYIHFNSLHFVHTHNLRSPTAVTRLIMGDAGLTYAAVWRLVHSQWISSSTGSVIKVSSRPLQLCNRTLHAEQGRRSSAIRTIMQEGWQGGRSVKKQQDVHSCGDHERRPLTFLHHRGFRCYGWVSIFDVAGEVGLAVRQVFKQQSTVVAGKDACFGAFLEGGVLLLVRVGGVEESIAVCVLAERFRCAGRKSVFAIHPEVVLV